MRMAVRPLRRPRCSRHDGAVLNTFTQSVLRRPVAGNYRRRAAAHMQRHPSDTLPDRGSATPELRVQDAAAAPTGGRFFSCAHRVRLAPVSASSLQLAPARRQAPRRHPPTRHSGFIRPAAPPRSGMIQPSHVDAGFPARATPLVRTATEAAALAAASLSWPPGAQMPGQRAASSASSRPSSRRAVTSLPAGCSAKAKAHAVRTAAPAIESRR